MRDLRQAVFVDTSAYFAIANSADENHPAAVAVWRELVSAARPTATSNHVVAEFHALMVRTFGQPTALDAVDRLVLGSSPILRVSELDEQSAIAILRRYSDKTYTLVDAMSFVLMERLGISTAFTFDRHFIQHGFHVIGRDG